MECVVSVMPWICAAAAAHERTYLRAQVNSHRLIYVCACRLRYIWASCSVHARMWMCMYVGVRWSECAVGLSSATADRDFCGKGKEKYEIMAYGASTMAAAPAQRIPADFTMCNRTVSTRDSNAIISSWNYGRWEIALTNSGEMSLGILNGRGRELCILSDFLRCLHSLTMHSLFILRA